MEVLFEIKRSHLKFNKVYFPVDAIAKHEDFDSWYEDGDIFLQFKCKKGWKSEKDPVQIFGRLGGEVGRIKPDNQLLNYFIRYERYEYILHTYVIEHHYYVEGMVWDLYGCAHKPPFDFVEETMTSFNHKAVHVKTKEFKNHGLCYEIHVPDLTKLRIAVASVVAILIKEEWKGLSEGEEWESANILERLKGRLFEKKGYTYEQIQNFIALDSPLVRIFRPEGRPIDYKKQKVKRDKFGRVR